MITLLSVAVVVIIVILGILTTALIELMLQTQDLRKHLKLEDKPIQIDVDSLKGTSASDLGLSVDRSVDAWVVLILSHSCATCHDIGKDFLQNGMPSKLTVLMPESPQGDSAKFVDRYAIPPEKVVMDFDGAAMSEAGLNISPAAVVFEGQRIVDAMTMPSTATLNDLLSRVQNSNTSKKMFSVEATQQPNREIRNKSKEI